MMDKNTFRVLGIALVAEEVGAGAHLVFRYPATSTATGTSKNVPTGDHWNSSGGSGVNTASAMTIATSGFGTGTGAGAGGSVWNVDSAENARNDRGSSVEGVGAGSGVGSGGILLGPVNNNGNGSGNLNGRIGNGSGSSVWSSGRPVLTGPLPHQPQGHYQQDHHPDQQHYLTEAAKRLELSNVVIRRQQGSTFLHNNNSNNNNSNSSSGGGSGSGGGSIDEEDDNQNDLFFRLSSRVMAKLFRSKPPLCGQPWTLAVGGTIFCCMSVLLQHSSQSQYPSQYQSQSDASISSSDGGGPVKEEGKDNCNDNSNDSISNTNNNNNNNNNNTSSSNRGKLVLFSIVVALLPINNSNHDRKTSSSWSAGNTQAYNDNKHNKNNDSNNNNNNNSNNKSNNNNNNNDKEKEYNSYPQKRAIRRIHQSLSRLCRVLEREEKRCMYVSRQVSMMNSIRKGKEMKRFEDDSGAMANGANEALNGDNSNGVGVGVNVGAGRSNDLASSNIISGTTTDDTDGNGDDDGQNEKTASNSRNGIVERERDGRQNGSESGSVTMVTASTSNGEPEGGGGGGGGVGADNSSTTSPSQQDASSTRPQMRRGSKQSTMPAPIAFGRQHSSMSLYSSSGSLVTAALESGISSSNGGNGTGIDGNNMNEMSSTNGGTLTLSQATIVHDIVQEREQWMAEQQQATVELMLAASPPPPLLGTSNRRASVPLHGNLARELAQTYHALSCNDVDGDDGSYSTFPDISSPPPLGSHKKSIVYVNRHVAVHIEAASLPFTGDDASYHRGLYGPHRQPYLRQATTQVAPIPRQFPPSNAFAIIRPYHTMLFPHISPCDLLQRISSLSSPQSSSLLHSTNGGGKYYHRHHHYHQNHHRRRHPNELLPFQQRHVEKLLLAIQPFKSLADVSTDTALPLPIIIEAASSLVESGMCVVAPVLSRSVSFVCQDGATNRIASLALTFSQQFGPMVPLFLVVSVLTTPAENHRFHSGGLEVQGGDVAARASQRRSSPTGADRKVEQEEEDFDHHQHQQQQQSNSNHRLDQKVPITLGDVMSYCSLAAAAATEDHVVDTRSIDDEGTLESDEMIPLRFQVLAERISSALRSETIPPGYMLEPKDCLLPDKYAYYHQGSNVAGSGGGSGSDLRYGPRDSGSFGDANDLVVVGQSGLRASGGGRKMMRKTVIPQSIEDAILTMAVWLRSHFVIVELKDYITLLHTNMVIPIKNNDEVDQVPDDAKSSNVERHSDKTLRVGHHSSLSSVEAGCDVIYQDLLSNNYLTSGNISTTALAWKLGLDEIQLKQFQDWGIKEKKIMSITRVPRPGDDWGAP